MRIERLIAIYSGVHLLLLFPVLPDWVKVVAMGAWALGMIAIERGRPWSSRLMQIFAGIGFVATFASVRPVFGIENSACLAAWVLAFQIHHLRNPRARLTQLIVCAFALAIHLVNDASLFNMFLMLTDLVFFFALLNSSQGARETAFRLSTLRSALRLMVLSFPIWILIFFFFPRFTLSLWGNPATGATAESGFGDEVRPGRISQVIQRDRVAFRFAYQMSQDQKLFYFRGGVLSEARGGLHWVRGRAREVPLDDGNQIEFGFIHDVWLEPRWSRSLFAGEYAQGVITGFGLSARDIESLGASVFQLRFTPRRLTYYQVSSTKVDLAQGISDAERRAATALPPEVIEDLRAVKDGPRLKGLPAARAVAALDDWYRERKFRYSQEAPVVPEEKLSVFLNELRVGFCEHYAAASAVLLRAAGIPARVVIGFLGGTYNPIAQSYTMFDRDAHAWLEYHDETSGRWTRYDPTESIQPLRFSIGSEIYRLTPEELDQVVRGNRATDLFSRVTGSLGLVWDAWTHELERRIVFYDAGWMTRFYEEMGIPQWGPWITGLVAILAAALLLIFLRGWLRVRTQPSRGERLWRELRSHYRIPEGIEGEMRTLDLIAQAAGPAHAQHFAAFGESFLRYRYGNPRAFRPRWDELREEWRRLKRLTARDGTRERVAQVLVLNGGRTDSSQRPRGRGSAAPHVKSLESGL